MDQCHIPQLSCYAATIDRSAFSAYAHNSIEKHIQNNTKQNMLLNPPVYIQSIQETVNNGAYVTDTCLPVYIVKIEYTSAVMQKKLGAIYSGDLHHGYCSEVYKLYGSFFVTYC